MREAHRSTIDRAKMIFDERSASLSQVYLLSRIHYSSNERVRQGSPLGPWLHRVSASKATSVVFLRRSYLVDPASSHMLVSKIKPCMSKYKHLYCETANGSLNQLSFI